MGPFEVRLTHCKEIGMRASAILVFACCMFASVTTTLGDHDCNDCPAKIRGDITFFCRQQFSGPFEEVCLSVLEGISDESLETNACETLNICSHKPWKVVTCNKCTDKFKLVLKNFCNTIPDSQRVFWVKVKDFCKIIVANTKKALYKEQCKVGNGVVNPDSWGYTGCNGPYKWAKNGYAGACTGTRQSPINLKTSIPAQRLDLLTFSSDYYSTSLTGSLMNDGRTLVFTVDPATAADSHTVTGQALNGDTYKPYEIKFHWGSIDSQGSEHTINGISSAMEMQIYHQNTKYTTVAEAQSNSDGILAVAFLMKVDDAGAIYIFNTEVDQIVAAADQLTETVSTSVNLGTFLDEVTPSSFYLYTGSLTTPECSANVKWLIFDEELAVSQTYMNAVRQLTDKDDHSLADNYRPTQPLAARSVGRFG